MSGCAVHQAAVPEGRGTASNMDFCSGWMRVGVNNLTAETVLSERLIRDDRVCWPGGRAPLPPTPEELTSPTPREGARCWKCDLGIKKQPVPQVQQQQVRARQAPRFSPGHGGTTRELSRLYRSRGSHGVQFRGRQPARSLVLSTSRPGMEYVSPPQCSEYTSHQYDLFLNTHPSRQEWHGPAVTLTSQTGEDPPVLIFWLNQLGDGWLHKRTR
ncbi:hypothetical protein Bbelb_434770 [Branchiostoma belcheri]|nr:hypothetical protein Bbelb_434770 [Branchiostoma belcheri]